MKRFRAWWDEFRGRAQVARLSAQVEQIKLSSEARVEQLKVANETLAKEIALAKLEIADLLRRLETEREANRKSRRYMEKMWRFIAVRHRVDVVAENGSIRQHLQQSEVRK